MKKIYKITNIALIFTLIIGALACLPETAYALRVPVGMHEMGKRILKAMQDSPGQKISRSQFRLPDTNIFYRTYETTNADEIEKTLNKWFKAKEGRYWEAWDSLIKKYILNKKTPNGFFVKLESNDGKVLAIGFFHKEDKFMFSQNSEKTRADVASVYFYDLAEVTDEYRSMGLGKILVACALERALNDPDIGARVLIAYPVTAGEHSSSKFLEDMDAVPINIFISDLEDDIESGFASHYLFFRKQAERELHKVMVKNSNFIEIEKAKWSDIKFINKPKEVSSSNVREVIYKGETYFAKWEVNATYDERFLVPEAGIIRYLGSKGVKGIPKVEYLLEMETGRKVMLLKEFDPGESFDKLGRIPPDEAVRIVLEALKIAKSCLDNGVYHWDIKPENIRVSRSGEVMIFDFGLAFMTKDEFVKRVLYENGTPLYMSPGRLRGSRKYNFSHSDEIYSFAVTMMKMLGINPGEDILYAIYVQRIEDPAKVFINYIEAADNIMVPKEIKTILKKALRMEYHTIDKFIDDLENLKLKDSEQEEFFEEPFNTQNFGITYVLNSLAPARTLSTGL
jgi:serine/threonine protein kinase